MWTGFVAFDQYKAMLQDADGKISGPRTVIAGFGAGVTESLLAVTPFESIKTTLFVFLSSSPSPSRSSDVTWVWIESDKHQPESTTASPPNLASAASSTPCPSLQEKEASEASSKALSLRPPGKQLTAQPASAPTPSCANWHSHTRRPARSSARRRPLGLVVWRA